MTQNLTVAASEVRVGDKMWNGTQNHPAYEWVSVTAVSRTEDGQVKIDTNAGWYTYKHPREGVGVQRMPAARYDEANPRGCRANGTAMHLRCNDCDYCHEHAPELARAAHAERG